LRGIFSTAALIAASVLSTHCCSLCDDRATLIVRLLPPAARECGQQQQAAQLATHNKLAT
jgi:hypothetical protein